MNRALVIVAKQPAPGKTKTRLSPPLSMEQAAELYACFLEDTLDIVRHVLGVERMVTYTPESAGAYFAHLAPDFTAIPQRGPDLGSRLDNTANTLLERGFQQILLINSDGPNLPATYLQTAFDKLADGCDIVLGPCDDGGYYAIGLKESNPRIFRNVRMSTSTVTRDTLAIAGEMGLRVHLLPTWYDVDDLSSLKRLATELDIEPSPTCWRTGDILRRLGFLGKGPKPESQWSESRAAK